MTRNDHPEKPISATRARQAVKTGRVRWILALSVVGYIAAVAIAYFIIV